MKKQYDVVIIGCGTSGAAIAMSLARFDLKVAVLEKENDVATGTTRANSGILHAGYDPLPGTLMAKLNVRGAELGRKMWCDSSILLGHVGQKIYTREDWDGWMSMK